MVTIILNIFIIIVDLTISSHLGISFGGFESPVWTAPVNSDNLHTVWGGIIAFCQHKLSKLAKAEIKVDEMDGSKKDKNCAKIPLKLFQPAQQRWELFPKNKIVETDANF